MILHNGLVAAGAVIHYLKDTEHPNLQHIVSLQRIDRDDFLWMDRFTIRNLELIAGSGEGNHTLLSVLDNTVSPMGARRPRHDGASASGTLRPVATVRARTCR